LEIRERVRQLPISPSNLRGMAIASQSDSHFPLIHCHRLFKSYPMTGIEVHALRGIDLDINEGEMVAIMGASGSGKSTLMNIIGCMDKQTSGEYYLDDADISKQEENELAATRNRKMGFVFQRYNLLARSTALYNVELPMFYASISGAEAEQRAREALEDVGLKDFMHHWPNQMSGGQQQRVSIARAMVNRPLVLLADEPTGALDTVSTKDIMAIFQKMHQEQGTTVMVITHEPSVADYCQRKVVIRDGQIVSDDKVANQIIARKSA
jgi:putative ABC transport system ATP-binding protein